MPFIQYNNPGSITLDHGALTGLTDNDHPQYNYGFKADVRLEYTDANTITLTGVDGTNKYCEVNGSNIDCSSDSTIDTDSASHFIVTGTTTVAKSTALSTYTGNGSDGNAYNAYGLFHVYLANNDAAFNFASYDRRNSIFLSPNAPTDGYLAASGDGANARHVGCVALNSSRQFDHELLVSSTFNRLPTGVVRDLGPNSAWVDISDGNEDTIFTNYIVVAKEEAYTIKAFTIARNDDPDGGFIELRIKVNGVEVADHAMYLQNDGILSGQLYPELHDISDSNQVLTIVTAIQGYASAAEEWDSADTITMCHYRKKG
jgi:hypothetical protein